MIRISDPPIQLPDDAGGPVFFASLIAGLEPIVAREMSEKIAGLRMLGMLRGRVLFSCDGPPANLLGLMTIENLFGYAGQMTRIPADESGLGFIEERISEMALEPALALFEWLHGSRSDPSFRVTAQRTGQHAYNSPQIAAAAGAGVVRRYGWRVDLEQYDYDVRVYVTDDCALVGLRLSREALHKRGRVAHGVASLNPTVAHAMCRVAAPTPGETFVDPMCGSGTILVERSGWGDGALVIGGDASEEPLGLARRNLVAQRAAATLVNWDAKRLPLADASVDKLVSNLPWGRRIGSHRINVHLYPGFMRETARVLRPGGVAVLLTQEKRLLLRLLDRRRDLSLRGEYSLSLSGMRPTIYVVQKGGEQ
jgi:23S rRNA G2445 N2-methylase RlmL